MQITDVCDVCERQHEIGQDNSPSDRLYLFINDPRCNHLLTICPGCGYATRMYVPAELVLEAFSCEFPTSIVAEADDDLKDSCNRAYNRGQVEAEVIAELERRYDDSPSG